MKRWQVVSAVGPMCMLALACPTPNDAAPPGGGPSAAVQPPTLPATPTKALDARPEGPEHLVFSAEGWAGGRGRCTEQLASEGCDSEWTHPASAQLVRVFVVPVADSKALPAFVDKLSADVRARGGLAETVSAGGMALVRFLEHGAIGVAGAELATLNYALIGRDQRAVHLITSVVPFDLQQPADERLRALLTSASWAK
jgi:hypothetical protein